MYGTVTQPQTFTITDARYLASKVKTDLSRMRQFYNAPTEARINEFETELIALLSGGYLTKVSYGFRRNNAFVPPTLEYTAAEFADGSVNDRPGGVAPGADISGATFYSFLETNSKFENLPASDKAAFEATLPFKRGSANTPSAFGHFETDKSYFSGGTSLGRKSLKAWS